VQVSDGLQARSVAPWHVAAGQIRFRTVGFSSYALLRQRRPARVAGAMRIVMVSGPAGFEFRGRCDLSTNAVRKQHDCEKSRGSPGAIHGQVIAYKSNYNNSLHQKHRARWLVLAHPLRTKRAAGIAPAAATIFCRLVNTLEMKL
jgi:hypothetical protein